jgi:hypothetical protein
MPVKLSSDREGPAVWLAVDIGRALREKSGRCSNEDESK